MTYHWSMNDLVLFIIKIVILHYCFGHSQCLVYRIDDLLVFRVKQMAEGFLCPARLNADQCFDGCKQ